MPEFQQLVHRLIHPGAQRRTCKTVEWFGWLILAEGALFVLVPSLVVAVLDLPSLSEQGASYFRLAGVLISGLGMLYIVSGRLNSVAFAFASLLDRPLVPPLMGALWALEIIPGPLALAFSAHDLAGFLWTLTAWRREARQS